MTAGPEHDHDAQPGKTSLRTAWHGSRRFAVMAGVVTLGVLAGAGVAVAATSSSGQPAAPGASASPSASASARPQFPPKGQWRMRPPGGGPFAFGGPGGGPFAFGGPGALGALFGAVHGTAVVPKAGGGYQTIAFQNGKVTAVSSTSITLHSADGYTHSYQVTSSTLVNAQRDGIGSIKAGNQVIVIATVSGSTATATRIIDVSLLQQGLHRFFGGAHGPNFKVATP
jgi:hypothetical protein